jgi:hypothetical protein
VPDPTALVEVPTDLDEFNDEAMRRGWGDGLPLVPPTPERVSRMLDANPTLDPDEVVGVLPPRNGVATVRTLAVNAVMAGCRPEHLPVVTTATRCMVDPAFNLEAVQSTTHPVAPLVVLHGPVVARLGANARYGCFGPGNRTNAAVGRAVRLALWNIGGGRPDDGDQSGQGAPSKYTFCIAENQPESPWPPLHVRRGLAEGTSAVSVFPAAGPDNVNDHVSGEPVGILTTMASSLAALGGNNAYANMGELVCVFNPEHAGIIAAGGWGVDDVQHYLYEHARNPLGRMRGGGMWGMGYWPAWMTCEQDDDKLMPVTRDPRDFVVLVAGGSTKHSSILRGFASPRSVTLPLDGGDPGA